MLLDVFSSWGMNHTYFFHVEIRKGIVVYGFNTSSLSSMNRLWTTILTQVILRDKASQQSFETKKQKSKKVLKHYSKSQKRVGLSRIFLNNKDTSQNFDVRLNREIINLWLSAIKPRIFVKIMFRIMYISIWFLVWNTLLCQNGYLREPLFRVYNHISGTFLHKYVWKRIS